VEVVGEREAVEVGEQVGVLVADIEIVTEPEAVPELVCVLVSVRLGAAEDDSLPEAVDDADG
jgi:hypothetical protein